jgi:hypothetical protein
MWKTRRIDTDHVRNVRRNLCRKCRFTRMLVNCDKLLILSAGKGHKLWEGILFFNHEFSLMLSQTSYLWSSLLCIFYVTTQSGRPQENSRVRCAPFRKLCAFFGIFVIDLDTCSTENCRSRLLHYQIFEILGQSGLLQRDNRIHGRNCYFSQNSF